MGTLGLLQLLVSRQQLLVQRELGKRQVSRLQPVETRFATGVGPCLCQHLFAIHAGKDAAILLGVALLVEEKLDAGAQGTVVAGTFGREHRLVELHGPIDEIESSLQLTGSQRQHGFQLAHPQGVQRCALGGSDAQQLTHSGALVVPLFIQLIKQRHILLGIPIK